MYRHTRKICRWLWPHYYCAGFYIRTKTITDGQRYGICARCGVRMRPVKCCIGRSIAIVPRAGTMRGTGVAKVHIVIHTHCRRSCVRCRYYPHKNVRWPHKAISAAIPIYYRQLHRVQARCGIGMCRGCGGRGASSTKIPQITKLGPPTPADTKAVRRARRSTQQPQHQGGSFGDEVRWCPWFRDSDDGFWRRVQSQRL